MQNQFYSNDLAPKYNLADFFRGQDQSLNQQKEEEDILKSQLANILSAGKMPNDFAVSNFEGAKANTLNNPLFLAALNRGSIGEQQTKEAKGLEDIGTYQGKIDSTNSGNRNKVLSDANNAIFMNEQARRLAEINAGQQPSIGFGMVQQEPAPQPAATPSALFATMQRLESGGRRYGKDGKLLTSSKGAQGENQVMPATQKDPGYGVTPARDDSPDEIARVGKDYIEAMFKRYGNEEMALAAYNAGPAALDKILAQAQKTGVDWRTLLPEETKAYVAKSGYSNQPDAKIPQNVLAPFATNKPSETPWSNQMSPDSRQGQMAAVLGMGPEFAKQAALAEQRGADALEIARTRAESQKKLNDPKYKEQLMAAFKTMADPNAEPMQKYEAEMVIYYDQQMRLAGAPAGYTPKMDLGQMGIPMRPAPVAQNQPPQSPGAAAKPQQESGTIADYRKKYPQYAQIPDDKLKAALEKQGHIVK